MEQSPQPPNSEFEAIIDASELRVPRERYQDPVLGRLLDTIRQEELRINRQKDLLSPEDISSALVGLDEQWTDALPLDAALVVAGKIRPLPGSPPPLEVDGMYNTVLKDDSGQTFYEADGVFVTFSDIDLMDVQGQPRIVLNFTIGGNQNTNPAAVYILPEDIEYILPVYSTREGLEVRYTPDGEEEVIRRDFPEIYRAIEAIPETNAEPSAILQSLRAFRIHIDPMAGNSLMGSDEVLQAVERIVTRRVALIQDEPYTVAVDGEMQLRDQQDRTYSLRPEAQISVYPGGIGLLENNPPKDAEQSDGDFALVLHGRMKMAGDGDPTYACDLPFASITAMRLETESQLQSDTDDLPLFSLDTMTGEIASSWHRYAQEIGYGARSGPLSQEQMSTFFERTRSITEGGEVTLRVGDTVSVDAASRFIAFGDEGNVRDVDVADDVQRIYGYYDGLTLLRMPIDSADNEGGLQHYEDVARVVMWLREPYIAVKGELYQFDKLPRIGVVLGAPLPKMHKVGHERPTTGQS